MGAVHQASNKVPPRRGAVLVFTADTTPYAYSLAGLALGGFTPCEANNRNEYVYLTLHAENDEIYYYFSSTGDEDLDDTAAIAADGAVAFAVAYGARLAADQEVSVRIDRSQDKYLVICSATGSPLLRVWASSEGF